MCWRRPWRNPQLMQHCGSILGPWAWEVNSPARIALEGVLDGNSSCLIFSFWAEMKNLVLWTYYILLKSTEEVYQSHLINSISSTRNSMVVKIRIGSSAASFQVSSGTALSRDKTLILEGMSTHQFTQDDWKAINPCFAGTSLGIKGLPRTPVELAFSLQIPKGKKKAQDIIKCTAFIIIWCFMMSALWRCNNKSNIYTRNILLFVYNIGFS